jgi:phosphoesterase RecJ-like protein
MLITYNILKEHYPNKEVTMKTHQLPTTNLPGMKEITVVKKIQPEYEDLVILLDTATMDFVEERVDTISNTQAPIVTIDHHDNPPEEENLNINELRSSATEQVIFTFKEILGKNFKLTKRIAELGQYGIVADTGRFLYDKTSSDTFRLFAELVDVIRLDLETIAYKQSKIPSDSSPAIIEFLKTLRIEKDMSYKQGVNQAKVFLRDRFLRHIQGVHWGFIVSPGFEYGNDWFVAFRSTKGYQDVKIIAEELGGGGHEYSSGVPMTGNSIEEVLGKILKAVNKHVNLRN